MSDPLGPLEELLQGRYRIERELGRGGMGTVYLVRDERHDRSVAMKVLRPDFAAMVGSDRFLQEIRITAHLQHPNILPLFDSGELGGVLYYVMPFVEGETLRDRMNRERTLPAADAIGMVRVIAGALDYAHGRGVIHRDIKPENVLLSPGGPMIADFGIARTPNRETARLTETGMALGTAAYMSPEQASGEPHVDGRSDIYSLAVMLFEMLTGNPPFDGPNAMAITAMKLTRQPPSIRRSRADLSAELDRVLRRALAPAPEDRFPTTGEFAAALENPSEVGGRAGIRSVAVMPFTNMSPNADDDYLSDGLAEELIHVLSAIDDLRVVARSSSFVFKGRNEDPRTIGEALGVDTLLDGTVRRAGSRLRVGASLIDAGDGSTLWSNRFDRECDDVLTVQDEIAQAVASAFKAHLRVPDAPRTRPVGFEAYDLYLRGLQAVNRRTEESLNEGLDWFDRALAADSGFATATAARAHALVLRGVYGQLSPSEAMVAAERAAGDALALDAGLADASAALACVQSIYRWDWGRGEATFRTALAANPTSASVHHWFAVNNLAPRGRADEARAALSAARRLDPISSAVSASVGLVEFVRGRTESAIAIYRDISATDPGFALAHLFLGEALAHHGQLDEAVHSLRTASTLAGHSNEALAAVGHAEAQSGRPDEANRLLDLLHERARQRYVSPSLLARIHLGLSEYDAALTYLERAVEMRCPYVVWLAARPLYAPLRTDRRFTRLLERIGLSS